MKHTYNGYCRRDKTPTIMYAYEGTFEEGRTTVQWSAEVSLGEVHKGAVKGVVDGSSEIGTIRRAVEEATKVAINNLSGMLE